MTILNTEHHEQVYGQEKPAPDLAARMRNDFAATLAAMVNVYGDLCRPPLNVVSWPRDNVRAIEAQHDQMIAQLALAEHTAGADKYRALAGAMGYYQEMLKQARRLADRVNHAPLNAYVKAAQRATRRLLDPDLFIAAVDGGDTKLDALIIEACKVTRKRFGDQLVQHGVMFDPPAVADQYIYQPEGS